MLLPVSENKSSGAVEVIVTFPPKVAELSAFNVKAVSKVPVVLVLKTKLLVLFAPLVSVTIADKVSSALLPKYIVPITSYVLLFACLSVRFAPSPSEPSLVISIAPSLAIRIRSDGSESVTTSLVPNTKSPFVFELPDVVVKPI